MRLQSQLARIGSMCIQQCGESFDGAGSRFFRVSIQLFIERTGSTSYKLTRRTEVAPHQVLVAGHLAKVRLNLSLQFRRYSALPLSNYLH